MTALPAVFFGHGNPMNALDSNRYTEAWRAFGESVSTPRAILVISAHWYTNATALTAMSRPRTIHDFYGFPQELYEVEYPAPGAPEVAEEVAELVKPTWIGLDSDTWGLDHGTWSVLTHAFPKADVPVVQLSINALKPAQYHVELGARLAPLRERGILVVGSGNIVHNLAAIDWEKPNDGLYWAKRFNEAAKMTMLSGPAGMIGMNRHHDFHSCVPTPEHFIPMLYISGVAGQAELSASILVDGYTYGSIAMTSYVVGAPCPPIEAVPDTPAPAMPNPDVVPPDDTNT